MMFAWFVHEHLISLFFGYCGLDLKYTAIGYLEIICDAFGLFFKCGVLGLIVPIT